MGSAFIHGWVSLPTCGGMYLMHGVPRRVWVRGDAPVDVERLRDEIAEVAGFQVSLCAWEPGEEAGAMEANLHIRSEDIGEVLLRLARASAQTFYDRYRKPIDASDTDFDDESYAQDISAAMDSCGLHWGDVVDQRGLRERYRPALHKESEEIVRHPD